MTTIGVPSTPSTPRPIPRPPPIGRVARRNGDNSPSARSRRPRRVFHGNEGKGKDCLASKYPREKGPLNRVFRGEARSPLASLHGEVIPRNIVTSGHVHFQLLVLGPRIPSPINEPRSRFRPCPKRGHARRNG